MKKIIALLIICLIFFGGVFFAVKNMTNPNKVDERADVSEKIQAINKDIVKIVDGKIQNEFLIDEFINKTEIDKENAILKIQDIIIDDSSDFIEIEFNPGKLNEKNEMEYEEYILKIDDEEKKLSGLEYFLKRKTEDGKVYLYFDSIGVDKEDVFSPICNYDLDSSYYKKDFSLNFNQRKDMGAKKIIGPESSIMPIEYSVYTVGGDVTFTIGNNMVYDIEKIVKERIITPNQILEQAKRDNVYGICKEEMYSDGGTLEYLYDDYTIIKFNTLDGKNDLIIGPKGNIRNQVDSILY